MRKRSFVDRVLQRVGLQRMQQRSTYAGAKLSRLNADWFTSVLSADQAIKQDLRLLRDRSRALVRDNSYASRFVQSVAENVAGPTGATLQVRVAKASGAYKQTLNDTIEAAWNEWAEDCTVDGMAFTDVEHLLCETLPQDGAFLVRLVPGYRGNRFRFALQILDADQVDHTYCDVPKDGRGEIRHGVEIDRWGRPVGVWIWTQHPSEARSERRTREFLPADQIIYGFLKRRPGQTIPVPWFAPVLLDERMLQAFQEAAVTAARIGAANTFFLKADPNHVDPSTPILEPSVTMEVQEGVGQVLPPGYDVAQFDPTYPNNEFDPFSRAILQSIATGLRVSHLTLTGDLRQANYSSMRAGLLPERDAWRTLFGWFTRNFHRHVYRAWLKTAVLSGAVQVPPRELDKALREVKWQQRGFWSVDPSAELDAAQKEVAMGVNTLTRLAAQRGHDFEELMQERRRELDIAKDYDIPLGVDQYIETFGAQEPPGKQNTPQGDTDGEAEGADGTSDPASGSDDRARRAPLRIARSR